MRSLSALLVLLIASTLPAAEPPLTETQIARLESLCRVWGTVKFFHPWIVAPPDGKPIDWDQALIETIPLVEKATTAEEFRAAIGHLLNKVNDQATRVDLPRSTNSGRSAEPGLPETKTLAADGKKVLLIDATDTPRLNADPQKAGGGLFTAAFNQAVDCEAIILDLRFKDQDEDTSGGVLSSALRADIASLLQGDLSLPARRSRYHSGYAPEQGETSGGYTSGFLTSEYSTLAAKPGAAAGKRLIVLTSSWQVPGNLLAALQASGQALLLHDRSGGPPFASGPAYSLSLGEGVTARIRIADLINTDGSIGVAPDFIAESSKDSKEDLLLEKALAIATRQWTPPPRTVTSRAAGANRPVEKTYPEMTSPNREYRLLGLFRVWNVMHYFFPYKHLMDRSWDSVLTEFVPRFANAETTVEYGLATREFVAHLKDSHVGASGGPATASFNRSGAGSWVLALLRPLADEIVVVAIDDSLAGKVNVGDVLLEVDGQTIAALREELKKYVAYSTPQALERRLANSLLRGVNGPFVKLKLRASNGLVREETVRGVSAREAATVVQALNDAKKKTPVFTVLPEGFGYFDLVRLTVPQVNGAFDAVKDTPALIMDMRGYPRGTAWAICSRLTEKPMTMATFRRHYWTSPYGSEDRWAFDQRIQPSPLWKYKGKIVVLINEDAISQSEHSCLGFEEAAKGRITFIGTPTTGANGDITRTSLPGGITVTFSGHDVRHADGRQLQRLGIQPDIRVEPTIAGIASGQDEVLAAAIKFLNDSK